MSTTSSPSAPLARAAVCVAAFVALAWVSWPGIDARGLASFASAVDALGRPALSVAPELSFLVLARAIRRVLSRNEERPTRTRVIAAVFVGVVALSSLTQAIAIELFSDEVVTEIVSQPGWAFRIAAMLGRAAGAALAWQLAEWIRQTRVASGTFALFGAAALVQWIARVSGVASEATTTEIAVLTALTLVAVLALVALALATRRRPPVSWPVKVLGPVHLLSSVDLVVATLALGLVLAERVVLAARFGLSSVVPPGPLSAGLALLPGLGPWDSIAPALDVLGIAIAAGVGVLTWSRVARGEADRFGRASVVLASSMLVCVLVPPLAWLETGGYAHALAPSPWSGASTIDVVLVGDRPAAAHDADVLLARAEAIHLVADVAVLAPEQLHVVLHEVSGTAALDALLVPHRLVVALELDEPRVRDLPRGVRWVHEDGPAHFTGEESALRTAVETLSTVPGTTRVIECATPRRCETHLVDEATLTNRDVEDASVMLDEDGEPSVGMTLGPRGSEAFEDLTTDHVHENVAILIDGAFVTAPRIQAPIRGGHLRITLGWGAEDPVVEAEALAGALRAGPLDADWVAR